ncbi:alpha/beta hydrolase [Gordonia insulae]|uniref:Diacylglycerol acyltransferase/mycolyltransferase Ag85A n=1 Tax=Gordonia insulae TaxID=2420509 RepID=A0A3G8JK13_9ACTN|nr:alpha/beta hydrolase family protein [Gordonia insulae]AZG44839.1 Diacylglycerol acyltransferase/mycolyltransferase Ag85A [Gordonia insulae]
MTIVRTRPVREFATGASGRRFARVTAVAAIVVATVATLLGTASIASAAPTSPTIERVVREGPTRYGVYVYSVAMHKTVKVQVLVPRVQSGPRPSLYMLSGLGEEDPQKSIWLLKSDAEQFFADKNVTVALPLAGNGSFYADWQRDDPKLGRYKWETFLTKELPPLIDARFDGNGRRGIAGLSMGAGSSLMLAARNPGFYRAVAAYSGCYTTTGPAGQAYVRGIVSAFGGDPDNMWGPPDDPAWSAHDVLRHSAGLRGSAVYVSTGTGRAGRYDAPGYPGNSDPTDRQVVGGAIELGSLWCTQNLQAQLAAQRIRASFHYVDPGTHSWPYWVDQLHRSWPFIRAGLSR